LILILDPITFGLTCRDIYKMSGFVNTTSLNLKSGTALTIYSYKCIPSRQNRFCGRDINSHPEDWKKNQPCFYSQQHIKGSIFECPFYLPEYTSYWQYRRWNTQTSVVLVRGFITSSGDFSHPLFTTNDITATPIFICDNFGKIDFGDPMFKKKKVITNSLLIHL